MWGRMAVIMKGRPAHQPRTRRFVVCKTFTSKSIIVVYSQTKARKGIFVETIPELFQKLVGPNVYFDRTQGVLVNRWWRTYRQVWTGDVQPLNHNAPN